MDKTQHSSLDTAQSSKSGSQPLEDRALKEAARLFGEELMPLVGIKGTVKRIAATEQIKLAPQRRYAPSGVDIPENPDAEKRAGACKPSRTGLYGKRAV